MAVEQIAAAYYRAQESRTRQILAAVMALWADGDWTDVRRAAQLLALGQYAAARAAIDYVFAVTAAQGLEPGGLPVDPRAFAGVTAAGRDLVDVLQIAPLRVQTTITMVGFDDANRRGQLVAQRIVSDEIRQSGNNAEHVAMTADTQLKGYVRMLVPPSCSRCVILAGKYYRWSDGFNRHPGCDCKHVPAAEAVGVEDLRTDPAAYVRSLSAKEQDALLTKADAEAFRDGADLSRLVNVRQGALTSFHGGEARYYTGRKLLTAKEIYRQAAGSRAEALRLLAANGYLR